MIGVGRGIRKEKGRWWGWVEGLKKTEEMWRGG